MSKFQSLRGELRTLLSELAEDHGLMMTDTSSEKRTLIQLLDAEDGDARHPVRVEIEIWKPLNEDHSVAEPS